MCVTVVVSGSGGLKCITVVISGLGGLRCIIVVISGPGGPTPRPTNPLSRAPGFMGIRNIRLGDDLHNPIKRDARERWMV